MSHVFLFRPHDLTPYLAWIFFSLSMLSRYLAVLLQQQPHTRLLRRPATLSSRVLLLQVWTTTSTTRQSCCVGLSWQHRTAPLLLRLGASQQQPRRSLRLLLQLHLCQQLLQLHRKLLHRRLQQLRLLQDGSSSTSTAGGRGLPQLHQHHPLHRRQLLHLRRLHRSLRRLVAL